MRAHRTVDDLQRTVRAMAVHFGADEIYVIGSQAILAYGNERLPEGLAYSMDIDIYLANQDEDVPHEINANFGQGSQFEQTHGFHIDGVDELTAVFPPDWKERAVVREIKVEGRSVRLTAPGPEDLIVSKLARFSEKDKHWVETYVRSYGCRLELVRAGVRAAGITDELLPVIDSFLNNLEKT